MERNHLDQLTPRQLAQFLSPDFDAGWDDVDRRNCLRRQLQAPLLPDLLSAPGIDAVEFQAYMKGYTGPKTFGSQLTCSSPSLKVLSAIKAFGKEYSHSSEDSLI